MSACSLFERISVISNTMDNLDLSPSSKQIITNPTLCANSINPGGPGPGGGGGGTNSQFANNHPSDMNDSAVSSNTVNPATLERDYYGCYCLKFIVKNGTHITEDKVQQDFGQLGDVVDVRGPGLFSGLRGNHVYVRYVEKADAEEALKLLSSKYHQLTPASISDVLPDNYGLYTISFYNKTGIPSTEVRKEFSKYGEVKNLTGSLDVKGGRVFVSYKEKGSAVQALQAFFFRKDKYPNMKFALPRCEKDYFGCYCLKFYNKSGDVTEEKVLRDFGQFGEVVDVRGPGLFDVTGDDVYVRYKDKSSAEQALIELVGKYDSLCLAPPSDIQADKFGYFTITFVNDKCLSKSDVWYIFSKFGTVACVNGTFDCKKGRVFVSYKEKQGALNALETMLITKEYHLQVSKNSTVRKNDYNVVGGNATAKEGTESMNDYIEFGSTSNTTRSGSNNVSSDKQLHSANNVHSNNNQTANSTDSMVGRMANGSSSRELSRSRESSLLPSVQGSNLPSVPLNSQSSPNDNEGGKLLQGGGPLPQVGSGNSNGRNGLVKFNRNVEKDIFGYYCLSFLNEDGDINEKKVRHDFGKFGEVVSVRGALGKQKGHVFVRFRRKEAAENCLNCLNSFPLSEMSELFGKYLFLSPATPRDIDCDMYGLYSISFLNLNIKTFREIRQEFSKFGEIVRLTSGGGGNTDELVSISYSEKISAIKALQNHFTNKEFPYLDIAKGSSLLLVNSSDSSDNEDNESEYIHHHHSQELRRAAQLHQRHAENSSDPFHDPPVRNGVGSSDVVDELLKPFQSYFNIYRTGQYHSQHGDQQEFPLPVGSVGCNSSGSSPFINGTPSNQQPSSSAQHNSSSKSPDKKYRIKMVKPHQSPNSTNPNHPRPQSAAENGQRPVAVVPPSLPPSAFAMPTPSTTTTNIPFVIPFKSTSILASDKSQDALGMTSPTKANPFSSSTSTSTSSLKSTPLSSNQASPEREMLHAKSLAEDNKSHDPFSKTAGGDEETENTSQGQDIGNDAPNIEKLQVRKDLLGSFSLSFNNKSKDLTDRKLRLDFGGDRLLCVRGLAGLNRNDVGMGETVTVSFTSEENALLVLRDVEMHKKYPGLQSAQPMRVKPDKDGAFSVEFFNSGMSGIREITNEFSKHGEVVKVMAGGAKNAVKRVTVSYVDKNSALAAVKQYRHSKDFVSLDFAKECLEEEKMEN